MKRLDKDTICITLFKIGFQPFLVLVKILFRFHLVTSKLGYQRFIVSHSPIVDELRLGTGVIFKP